MSAGVSMKATASQGTSGAHSATCCALAAALHAPGRKPQLKGGKVLLFIYAQAWAPWVVDKVD